MYKYQSDSYRVILMIEQILEIINQYPKHFSIKIKKSPELWAWISEQTQGLSCDSISEQIYCALHGKPACPDGNKKKFIDISKGYGFCGKTGVCACAKEQIGKKVSDAKSKITKEENNLINEKRKKTLVKKYGVDNSGKLEQARIAHALFYSSTENVQNQNTKYKETMVQRYGVENGYQLPKVNWYRENANPLKDPKNRQKSYDLKTIRKSERYYLERSYSKIQEKIISELGVDFRTPIDEYFGVPNQAYYKFVCLKCGFEFETWLNCGHDPICKRCNPTPCNFVSSEEKELADWIESLGVYIIRNDRTLIKPFEIDIVIPELKIAIEYCGLFWHSEYRGGKDKQYHLTKFQSVENLGYRLITIFSDEWKSKKEITKRVLSHILKQSKKTIGARKTELRRLSKDEEHLFFNEIHLQGYTPSEVCYGLVFEDQIVGAMSFGKDRVVLNRKPVPGTYEIRRMAFRYNVPGGASRLFNKFVLEYSPSIILSDCDNRWSNGKIYEHLDMARIPNKAKPNYWYVDGYEKRMHRLSFTKKSLVKKGFDPDKTEEEIMKELGYDKIWDCGITRFIREFK